MWSDVLFVCTAFESNKASKLSVAIDDGTSVMCQECMCLGLHEDQHTCSAGQTYCHACIIKVAEVAVRVGKSKVECLNPNCRYELARYMLEWLLPAPIFQLLYKVFVSQGRERRGSWYQLWPDCVFRPSLYNLIYNGSSSSGSLYGSMVPRLNIQLLNWAQHNQSQPKRNL